MKAKIELLNRYALKEISFDTDKNEMFFNGEKKNIDVMTFATKFILIVSTWPKELIDESIIDGFTCKIEIQDEEQTQNYFIKNSYPKNFSDFTKLLKDVELWQK